MKTIKHISGENIYFFSDPHYNHYNICKGPTNWEILENTRDFDSIEYMNQTIIDNINNKVGEDDILYCLGDWSFGHPSNVVNFRKQIKCKNIYLILGNHDKHIRKNKDNIQSIFLSVQDYAQIQIDKQRIILMHYPIYSWAGMNHGSIHLFGHVHSKYDNRGKSMDVGVDNAYKLLGHYEPFSYEEILDILKNKIIKEEEKIII